MQRLLIIDDHAILRTALSCYLKNEFGCNEIIEADNGLSGIELVNKHLPDLIISDITMPELNGIDFTNRIRGKHPTIPIVILTAQESAPMVTSALEAGATGYVLKRNSITNLKTAISEALIGRTYLCPDISKLLVDKYIHKIRNSSGEYSPLALLSSREREVLQLLSEGHHTKEIAKKLGIGVKTIETHRRSVTKKLDIDSIAQLTRFAIKNGLTTL